MNDAGSPKFDATQLVALKYKLEADIEQLVSRHKTELAPFTEALQLVQSNLMKILNDQGVNSIKTDAGTFYKITNTSVRLDPDGGRDLLMQTTFMSGLRRALDALEHGKDEVEALHEFVSVPELDLIEVRAAKKGCQDWIQKTGEQPPGVLVEQSVSLGVRKT